LEARVNPSGTANSFLKDTYLYAKQMTLFKKQDWLVYVAWIGMMCGLFFSVTYFMVVGWRHGVQYPGYAWNVPIGIFIFVVAIAFDTIGHRTAYKEELKKGEALVHHITILAGVTSVLCLCFAYYHPSFFRYPAFTLISLAVFYSVIDEAMHWRRYLSLHSDRVEMWSHFFIFLGHVLMSVSWWHWFDEGYPGVRETLAFL
jgi:hypothetical protein